MVLHVFVDKGIVEVFANDRQAIARTVYRKLKGRIVKLFANGADIHVSSVKAWKLKKFSKRYKKIPHVSATKRFHAKLALLDFSNCKSTDCYVYF